MDALEEGRASVDRSSDRMVQVHGAAARRWLGDLVTADVASLVPGSSRRSLLLTPTGRIRADIWVAQTDEDAFLVLQSSDQEDAVIDALRPYVLSSSVSLEDATGRSSAIFVPARQEIITRRRDDRARSDDQGPSLVDDRAYELWRIGRGDPRMGVDFDGGSLPAESGLERLIDMTKGCFLGQESVAKIRNLGHPPTVLRHLRTQAAVGAGETVHDSNGVVGHVTSAAPARRGGTVALARVAWNAADAPLTTEAGQAFIPGQD